MCVDIGSVYSQKEAMRNGLMKSGKIVWIPLWGPTHLKSKSELSEKDGFPHLSECCCLCLESKGMLTLTELLMHLRHNDSRWRPIAMAPSSQCSTELLNDRLTWGHGSVWLTTRTYAWNAKTAIGAMLVFTLKIHAGLCRTCWVFFWLEATGIQNKNLRASYERL